ncbi:hypothetical protein E5676_scaffold1933G00110 [Cucumis melo var. makuwa]|uniref:Uncharacterized protein n=1 Tax=Cucumis melo var. makuwa TaxID=1194695 RepID=A0A5D3C7C5_CUCMM|nr:hypothetical protein E5676_scaffold1933G00110 [Cucumis melo var. makuwa]
MLMMKEIIVVYAWEWFMFLVTFACRNARFGCIAGWGMTPLLVNIKDLNFVNKEKISEKTRYLFTRRQETLGLVGVVEHKESKAERDQGSLLEYGKLIVHLSCDSLVLSNVLRKGTHLEKLAFMLRGH